MSSASDVGAKPKVPVAAVARWTAPWVVLIIGLLLVGSFTNWTISYFAYTWARRAAAIVLVTLAVFGVLLALELVGKSQGQPWYSMGLLVALVLFWGLCPPSWFFTEYYLIDQGTFALPDEVQRALDAVSDSKGKADLKATYLATTKTYADLASKIWVAVGAALATAIGFAVGGGVNPLLFGGEDAV